MRNEKVYLFGVDVMGDTKSSTLFILLYKILCGIFYQNSRGFLVALMFFLNKRGVGIALEPEKGDILFPIL